VLNLGEDQINALPEMERNQLLDIQRQVRQMQQAGMLSGMAASTQSEDS